MQKIDITAIILVIVCFIVAGYVTENATQSTICYGAAGVITLVLIFGIIMNIRTRK